MFYDNLIEECKTQGLKVTPLVKECGGASGSIAAWKRGAMPNSEIVLKLSMRLNVSCDYLLTGKKLESLVDPSLLDEEKELLINYRNLDSRGRHTTHSVIYKELDRMKTQAAFQRDDDESDISSEGDFGLSGLGYDSFMVANGAKKR